MTTSGGIVWLTGLSGAGKTTLATAVSRRLATALRVELLDGDELRTYVSAGLGYSRADRETNVHRIAYIARLLAKHGVLVLVAAISPYAGTRAEVRRLCEASGVRFVEIFVNATLETVIRRDAKGLYRKALAGEIASFTGISDPYEPPPAADLEVRTDELSVEECEHRLLATLAARGLLTEKS
jgi:adenylylsulfate kinase